MILLDPVVHGQLSQHQALLCGPSIDQVQRHLVSARSSERRIALPSMASTPLHPWTNWPMNPKNHFWKASGSDRRYALEKEPWLGIPFLSGRKDSETPA